MERLYEKYPKALGACLAANRRRSFTKDECATLIKVLELKNQLTDMELQSIYFRGCYDDVWYLKKAMD